MGRAIATVAGCGLAGLGIGLAVSIALFRQTTTANVLAGFAVTLGGVIIGSAAGLLIIRRQTP